MRKRIWISSEFINWAVFSEGMTLLDEAESKRAYEIWNHALQRLENNPTEMDRTDAITTLKRCLNQRLQIIEKHYKLRNNFGSNSKRYLQLLEELSLVRPLLLQSLMEIRNEIEHEDKRPPRLERCRELLDIIWYFLRSTDRITQLIGDAVIYEYGTYGVILDVEIKRKWCLKARGWLPKEFIFFMPSKNSIELLVSELQTNEKFKHSDKKDTDVYFSGEIISFPEKKKFVQQYFKTI